MTTWLQHVKQVHAAGSTSFKESLKRASASWKKTKGSAKAPKKKAPKKKRGKKKKEEEKEEEAISIEEPAEVPKKKKRRRRPKKASPDLPAKNFKNIDSRSLR